MAKIPGGFVPLDMHYLRDKDIRRAGPDAELLYIRSLAYAKANQTDGMVYDFDLEVVAVGLKNVHPRVSSLLRVGLWEKVDDGWRIRSWEKWNKLEAEIAVEKQHKSEAAVARESSALASGQGRGELPDLPGRRTEGRQVTAWRTSSEETRRTIRL